MIKSPLNLAMLGDPAAEQFCAIFDEFSAFSLLTDGSCGFDPVTVYFSSGEKGLILGSDDLSRLFQDSAGATPVTAVEQPVGLVLDLSGNGANAYQATSTKRPVLRARYNLLTYSEQFDNEAWTKLSGVVASNVSESPIGTITVDRATHATSINIYGRYIANAKTYTFSVYLKQSGSEPSASIYIFKTFASFVAKATLNFTTGVLTNNVGTLSMVENVGNGWFHVTLTSTLVAGEYSFGVIDTKEVLMWGADLREGTTIADYQRIAATIDYDTDQTKFPRYLEFDGIDDCLQTAEIGFSATDKMTVIAGVKKRVDQFAIICEFTNFSLNAGGFGVFDSSSTLFPNRTFGAISASAFVNSTPEVLAPTTYVGSMRSNRAAPLLEVRRNQVSVGSTTAAHGTGNYANDVLYIAGRAAAGSYFAGNIHCLIVRGAETPNVDLEPGETYVNERTGGY